MQASLWLALAAVATVGCFYVHTFIGGRVVARPLLADTGLPRASKWLNYYCWHVTTLAIAGAGLAYGWLAIAGDAANQRDFIVFLAAQLGAFSVLSAAVAIKAGINPLRFPSTYLFATMSALGWAALGAA